MMEELNIEQQKTLLRLARKTIADKLHANCENFTFDFSDKNKQHKADLLYKKLPLTECKNQFSYSYSISLYYFKMSKRIFDSIYMNRSGMFSWTF